MVVDLRKELQAHLPYSIFSTAIGLVLASVLTFVGQGYTDAEFLSGARGLFHTFHPTHLLLSATATAAMFFRYEQRLIKATLTGIVGAVVFCGIGDILIPAVGGYLLGGKLVLHICVLEHPGVVLPFVLLGSLAGCWAATTIERSTVYSHSSHVLLSTMGSIFYLIAFSMGRTWLEPEMVGRVFIVVTIAVMGPCCVSDIVFPLLVVRDEHGETHHEH